MSNTCCPYNCFRKSELNYFEGCAVIIFANALIEPRLEVKHLFPASSEWVMRISSDCVHRWYDLLNSLESNFIKIPKKIFIKKCPKLSRHFQGSIINVMPWFRFPGICQISSKSFHKISSQIENISLDDDVTRLIDQSSYFYLSFRLTSRQSSKVLARIWWWLTSTQHGAALARWSLPSSRNSLINTARKSLSSRWAIEF